MDALFAVDLQDSLLVECHVFSVIGRLCQFNGCARHKPLFLTAVQKRHIISFHAGLRSEGLPALNLWECFVKRFRA